MNCKMALYSTPLCSGEACTAMLCSGGNTGAPVALFLDRAHTQCVTGALVSKAKASSSPSVSCPGPVWPLEADARDTTWEGEKPPAEAGWPFVGPRARELIKAPPA